MTPSGGLRFARDTAVFPVGTAEPAPASRSPWISPTRRTTRRGHSGALSNQSRGNRIPAGARRLSFSREAGGISVVNGLGATITTLVYRDGDTVYRLDGSLAPGARAILKTGGVDAVAVVPSGTPLTSRFIHLVENQPRGSYLAVLEQSPFWEPGVSGVAERGSFHLVIGWPEGQP